MKTIDLTIDMQDLKILFLHTQHAYQGYTFDMFCEEVKGTYINNYLPDRINPKTFSEWVNAQIIAIAY